MSILVLFAVFTAILIIGAPIAAGLLLASAGVIALDPGLTLSVLPLRLFSGLNSFLLLAVPGFMFAAFLMNRIGVTRDVLALAGLLVGRLRGGLGHVNVAGSVLFGGISGSSTADVAGVGGFLIPAMTRKGFDPGFTAALTAASSVIGSVIPPSILMVIYGAAGNVSIGALFVAGYIPGLLIALQQILVVWFYARRHNLEAERQEHSAADVLLILARALIPLTAVVVIVGGIRFGIMTATEAAAVGAVYVMLLGVFVYRNLTLRVLYETALQTGILSAAVMFCVGAATLFGWLLTYYDVLGAVRGAIDMMAVGPVLFLFGVAAIFLVLGTFLDPAPAMLIFVPVLTPVAMTLGVDPVKLGLIVVMALSVGKITPPYGISLMLACTIAKIPLERSLGWTGVFVACYCALMGVIILW
ncbi:TRAP transporter large permease [Azospirillum sp. ST 5-10]|uniref:TRAP transporter large permease n=1 Tax=unclassified Azospirillum TaxID=2630922 RepID=UPI003F4A15FB